MASSTIACVLPEVTEREGKGLSVRRANTSTFKKIAVVHNLHPAVFRPLATDVRDFEGNNQSNISRSIGTLPGLGSKSTVSNSLGT